MSSYFTAKDADEIKAMTPYKETWREPIAKEILQKSSTFMESRLMI